MQYRETRAQWDERKRARLAPLRAHLLSDAELLKHENDKALAEQERERTQKVRR